MSKNITKLLLILVSTAGLLLDCSCTNTKPEQQKTPAEPDPNIPKQTPNPPKPADNTNPDPKHKPNPPKPNSAVLTNFLATPAATESVLFGINTVLTFDSKMTNHYNKSVPPAAVFIDYDHTGHGASAFIFAVANIPTAFEAHLPKPVKDALQSHNLLGKGAIDIRFVVQSITTLGEANDHGGVPTTTRIAAHGWIDPDAPATYSGTRVNRQFLQGIFSTQKDISTPQLPLGQLITTTFHVHDQLFSPRAATNLIKLGSDDDSQAFWIVVIDHQNPNGPIKALANLIWVLDHAKSQQLYKLSFNTSNAPTVSTFGELLAKLNASADFQGWHGLNLLNDLLK